MNLEELKEALRKLSAEDLANVKKFLDGEATEAESAPAEETKPDENKNTEAEDKNSPEQDSANAKSAPDAETPPVEEKPAEQPAETENSASDEQSDEKSEEAPAESTEAKPEEAAGEKPTEETAEQPQPTKETEQAAEAPAEQKEELDPIPVMQKLPAVETEQEAPTANVVADDGEELPVDYAQIIDGLKAKNMALEAENTRLKAKFEGAFGFSAKASAPAKVNRLYDDCDGIQMHK